MKYYELDKYEKEILNAFEKGKLKTIPNFKQKKKEYEAIAKNALNKTKNINRKRISRKIDNKTQRGV